MYRLLIVLILFLKPTSLLAEQFSVPNSSEVTRISAQHHHLLGVAIAEAEKRELSISKYELVLLTKGNGYVVIFGDPDRPEGIFGSSPNMSEFVVVLKANGEVVEAHFVR